MHPGGVPGLAWDLVIVMVGHSPDQGQAEVFGGRILIDPRNVCGDDEERLQAVKSLKRCREKRV